MRLAINQSVMFPASTDVFLDQCSENGIEAVELRVPKLKEWLYANSASKVRRQLKSLNIKVVAVNSIDDFGLVPQENLEILRSEAEFVGQMCEAVECPLVIAPVGRWFDSPLSSAEVEQKTLERLEILACIMDSYGVKLGVEPISFPEFSIKSIHDADKLCHMSTNKNNGLVVDYYNLFQNGMVPEDFSNIKAPVHIIHMNDSEHLPLDKLDVVSTRVFPGDGTLDAVKWTVHAIQSGYTGVFSLEIFQKNLWDMPPELAMFKIVRKINGFKARVQEELTKGA